MPSELLERFILDPTSEGGVTPLEVTGGMAPDPEGHGLALMEIQFPRPEVTRTWAGSRYTEGERPADEPRYMNRKIPVKVWGFEGQGIGDASNLIVNPSFEINTTSWATTGGALTSGGTLTRDIGGLAGEYVGNLVAGSANHGLGINATLAASTAYKLRFAARKITGSIASLTVARASTGLGSVNLGTDWQMFEIDVPATTAGSHFFSMRANAAGTFQIDAVSLQASSIETKYFDGDTPGCSWTGTAHASTSQRRGSGSDLKRFLDCIFDLESKLEKLARVGGTAKRYLSDGSRIAFDILDASYPADWQRTISQGRMEFSFELTAKPFARQPSVTLSTVNKASSTSVATIDTGTVQGNAPALVRLKVNDTGTAQRNHLLVGSAQATDPAMLLAKTRQLLGGALANSPTSAATTNGGATNGTVKMSMNAAWRPVLSTNESAPSYQTHEGPQRILARVFFPASNTADVNLKFEWAQADLARWNTSDLIDGSNYVSFTGAEQNGVWRWIDFGVVNLRKPRSDVFNDSAGWRWEGRLTARSASGDIFVDAFAIVPAANFLAEMFSNPQMPEPNETVIGLQQSSGSGNLASSTAAVGGTWSEIGGGTSYQYSAAKLARDPGTTDAAFKFARIGSSSQAAIYAEATISSLGGLTGGSEYRGLLLRYVDTSNYLAIFIATGTDGAQTLLAWSVKAGAATLLGATQLQPAGTSIGVWNLRAAVTAAGTGLVVATAKTNSAITKTIGWAASADLATGGTLASGGFGLAHRLLTTPFLPGSWWSDLEFRSLTASMIDDAVIFPSRSVILTHDNALRYDSAGSSLGEIGRYQGDRLTVPAGTSSRIVVLDGRVAPGATDSNLDTLSIDLSLIPRVVDVPEPS